MFPEAYTPLLRRSWYFSSLRDFQNASDTELLGTLNQASAFPILETQRDAWLAEFELLRDALQECTGTVYFEFTIPRMGHRVDAIVLVNGIVMVLEFKIGTHKFLAHDIDQAYDYAMDLKYFHEGSHHLPVVPILVASEAGTVPRRLTPHGRVQGLYDTVCTNGRGLRQTIQWLLSKIPTSDIEPSIWESSRYCPTPTIIEAARALYGGHGVADISRSDAGVRNLSDTSDQLSGIIRDAMKRKQKAICFVTGVPGAGKTLVGLNMATQYNDPKSELHSVFLSGNRPLVDILREALARDCVSRERMRDKRLKIGEARARVKSFIQNVHHFRDECLRDRTRPPVDHVAIFDEAQRAWNQRQTANFMKRRKGVSNFELSEPEFLISCMDRRTDWSIIICLVGGGQEINTGEAGIAEWIKSLQRSYPNWHIYLSHELRDDEYGAGKDLDALADRKNVHYDESLHLAVSVRSFRSEKVSAFVKNLLDLEIDTARNLLPRFSDVYPVVLTRDLGRARQWLRDQARGSERYGILVSSQAERLKPYALDVKSPVNPVKWFLDGKDDVRSSYYLEDVATEFHVQGLELDWSCVCWDGDFRHSGNGWQNYSFRGSKWQRINQPDRRNFLKNAYRVLLTRARQGMVLFVPSGESKDRTRLPEYYDSTFQYLKSVGLPEL